MSANQFERLLSEKIQTSHPDGLEAITPSVVLQVHRGGKLLADVRLGDHHQYYDWASLTKIVFTAVLMIRAVQAYGLDLRMRLSQVLSWSRSPRRLDQLLTHSAGYVWWHPFYLKLKGPVEPGSRWPQLPMLLKRLQPKPSSKSVYSDIDILYLGFVLEELLESSLFSMWQELQEDYQLMQTHFHIGNRAWFHKSHYAPTENCPWRKRVLQGEVHDENAWALGGVAPHAGLFGPIEDLSRWGLLLRRAYMGEGDTAFGTSEVVQQFVRRQIPRQTGDWGYGFMKPTLGRASCGRYFSAESFGHTGFTGTSLWFDPRKDLLVCILSNRVHPSRENRLFVTLRPKIHDWICELIG